MSSKTLLIWVGAFAITLAAFYGIDLFVMDAQGLPVNFDLTPAQ